MIVFVEKAYVRQVKKLDNADVKQAAIKLIEDLKQVQSIDEITNLKPMINWHYSHRVAIGQFRVGIDLIEPNRVNIISIIHRKEVYKKKHKR